MHHHEHGDAGRRFRVGATPPLARRGGRRGPPRRRRRGRRPRHRLPARHRARGRRLRPPARTAWRAAGACWRLDWPGQGRSAPIASRRAQRATPRSSRVSSTHAASSARCCHRQLDRRRGGDSLRAPRIRSASRALVLENPGGLDRTDDLVARTAIRAMVAFFAAGARGASWFPPPSPPTTGWSSSARRRRSSAGASSPPARRSRRCCATPGPASASRRPTSARLVPAHPLSGAVRLGGARPAPPAPALPAGHPPLRRRAPGDLPRRPRPAPRDAGRVRARPRGLPRAAPSRGAPGARVAGGMTADGARIRWCTPR